MCNLTLHTDMEPLWGFSCVMKNILSCGLYLDRTSPMGRLSSEPQAEHQVYQCGVMIPGILANRDWLRYTKNVLNDAMRIV